jgi:hypothetical protein
VHSLSAFFARGALGGLANAASGTTGVFGLTLIIALIWFAIARRRRHDPAGLRAVGLASLRAERLVFAGIDLTHLTGTIQWSAIDMADS